MEIRFVILSVACFSCLVPPALSMPILAAKTLAAVGAAKGAAILGAGVLAKIALVKGIALKGAALLAAKAAAVKTLLHNEADAEVGNAKITAVLDGNPPKSDVAVTVATSSQSSHAGEKTIELQPVVYQIPQATIVLRPPTHPFVEKINGLLDLTKNVMTIKTLAVGQLLKSLISNTNINSPPKPTVYQIVTPLKFYPVPLVEKTVKK